MRSLQSFNTSATSVPCRGFSWFSGAAGGCGQSAPTRMPSVKRDSATEVCWYIPFMLRWVKRVHGRSALIIAEPPRGPRFASVCSRTKHEATRCMWRQRQATVNACCYLPRIVAAVLCTGSLQLPGLPLLRVQSDCLSHNKAGSAQAQAAQPTRRHSHSHSITPAPR